jgi:hypothetical protein
LRFVAESQRFLHVRNAVANAFTRAGDGGAAQLNTIALRGFIAARSERRRTGETLISAERVCARRAWDDARNHVCPLLRIARLELRRERGRFGAGVKKA